ncbi:LOW QUALITY PROTEIN: uncharacterized protein LOC117330881 [Pecten maximus]|uniref:LOW QUALITY PROTEIN: uncharacterized protein LOC117330881 n=1 Tax=Pecten maximus TaxID=6579 RepID=UPI001457EA13|nr:LOW QUALITY PROTEIN: uncharacterized protein LOC117330881 [Pecten maximus]
MSGVTLPAIPGAYPSSVRSLPLGLGLGNNHGSRPSSSGSGSTSFTLAPHVYYDNCLFRSPSRTGTSRSVTKFPSLRPGRNSHGNNDVRSRYSAKYRSTPDMRQRLSANSPFLPKTATEDCLKCLLKVPHKKCESHKYIRVGGGYRHGYWYVKCLLEELELQRQRELIMKQRLESIREKQMKAIKTYIRTKSGRIVEKIIFLSEEDYEAFKEGKNVEELLKKYLSKDEAKGLQSWDKDEVKAIKTMVRTKSGRLVEKLVYVSKEDYDAITAGKVDAKELLKKYAKDGEVIEGWKEAAMKTIKTYVRTKSGRIIEKTIMISQEDYDAMIKEGKNPDDILKKYITLEEGQQLESWKSAEPMKAIKTKIRTKSGRIIEKTIYVSADDYDKMMQGGGDPNDILKKYMGEDEGTIEGWSKADPTAMKVVKTYVRTKSGRLIEKVIMLTEDEYKQFVEAGGDPEFLKKFIQLEKGEVIDSWEKASTVYSGGSDQEMIQKAKVGERIVGKDGAVYEIIVDPLTGKKYKKKIESDVDSGIASMQKGKKGKKGKGGKGGEFDSDDETPEERRKRKAGGRNADSAGSAFSYKSVVSAGGTRHVRRRRKREDGTYSDSASYHSSQDEDGQARRRRRRRERKHGADSANSYYSVVSDGGTRHVKRRRRRGDGTYSRSVSYHSSDSGKEGGRLADKKKKKRRQHGADSDYSYESDVSAGGTHTRKRKKKIRDAKGNVIGYGSSESYTSDDESVYTTVSDGKGGKIKVKKEKPGRGGKGGKGGGKGGKGKKKLEPVFSDCTTDDDDVDLENMTEEEKKAYFKAKAERAAVREKKRREKYGDKYDEMMSKHQDFKKAKAKEKMKAKRLQELREQGLISPSSDWTIDSDTGEPLRKAEKAKVEQEKKRKKLQELREKGLISPSSDWTIGSDGEPARISDLIKQGKRKAEDYKKGGKGRRGKGKDGNDADDESDSETLPGGRRVSMQKSKLGAAGRRGSKNQAKGGKSVGKEKKQALKAGKRGNDSDSDFSYRSVVSAGGTRHVRRKRKRADGTYSDSESFHSSQDEEGEARRRRRRRDREHGANSAHSYYSVVSEGGTRHVRRRKRHEDGTYSASESYHSSEREDPDDEDDDEGQGETSRLSKDSGNDSDTEDSSTDYSYASETSEGGTRYETKRKRIRDADGNIVGYGDTKPAGKPGSDTESVRPRRGSVDERDRENLKNTEISNDKAKTDIGVPESNDDITGEEIWPGAEKVPSEFSDVTTDDDVDLSKMTEEEKKEYFAEKERKKQAREKRRREKYGSRYDEILKKKEQKRLEQLIKEQKEKDDQERLERELSDKERRRSSLRRSSLLSGKPREPPKSMVTYEKGTPREYGPKTSADKRDHGLGHESWGKKDKDGKSRRGSDSSMSEGFMPKFKRETTMLQKLPPIPQGKLYTGDDGSGQKGKNRKPSMVDKESTMDTDEAQFEIVRDEDSEDNKESKQPPPPEPVIEVGADGKLRLKKKKIDLSELDDATLRRLGIDPSLSAIEIAKKLKEMFGDDVKLTIGGEVIGTKGVDEFDSDMDDDKLADQEDLDLTTLKGKRRVNVLYKRGGSALKRHLQRIIDECTLLERAKRNLDERDSSIDFLAHYRLVDPTKIDGYAKAFVIEDDDFDTVININALQIALEGIEALSKMTPKQREYVIKVLHIDEATEVTFRMFSVITALCERVTNMDSLSQHLLEICNMADIERKMELYKAMFYHNIPSYRNNNFITSESLKIEMIAGGLNWNQQDFVMEKMEPNKFGEISFLDYMCYIPLFLSLHDNICDNPLDMSNNKYQMPPRKRPPSVQRDMNPLGNPLKKSSTHRMKARSLEVFEGKFPKEEYSNDYLDMLSKYARLPNIFTNPNKKRPGSASSNSESGSSTYNLIY